MAYVPVTDWVYTNQGTNTGSNKWLGAAIRIVKDDTYTGTGERLSAECSFYQHYVVANSGNNNIYKYYHGSEYSRFNTSTPHESINISNPSTAGSYPMLKGASIYVSLGDFAPGDVVVTDGFDCGWDGTTYCNPVAATYTVPASTPSGDLVYNRVIIDGVTYMDLSSDTVTSGLMLAKVDATSGAATVSAHDKNGARIEGSIQRRTNSNISISSSGITVAEGYYPSGTSKSVTAATATTPTTMITPNQPTITVSATGLITASVPQKQTDVTPTTTEGYMVANGGTAGTITVSATSNTQQMTTKGTTTITPAKAGNTIATAGTYVTGTISIPADNEFVAANIRKGKEIWGVTGTYTTVASANVPAAGDVISGKQFFVNGGDAITGSMPNRGTANYEITSVVGTGSGLDGTVTIQDGYHSGAGKASIPAADIAKLIPDNIKKGVTILGVDGDLEMSDMADIQAVKTVNAQFGPDVQEVTPDTGYDYLAKVAIRPITISSTATGNNTTGYTVTVAAYSS